MYFDTNDVVNVIAGYDIAIQLASGEPLYRANRSLVITPKRSCSIPVMPSFERTGPGSGAPPAWYDAALANHSDPNVRDGARALQLAMQEVVLN